MKEGVSMEMEKAISHISQESILSSHERVEILGAKIDPLTMKETIQLVDEYIKTKTPLHLIGVNSDKINEMKENATMQKIVNSCGIISADGTSIVLAGMHLNKHIPERVAGIDLMDKLINLCAKNSYKVFLLGAKDAVVKKTSHVLQNKYPKLNICGIHDGYFSVSEWKKISEHIYSAKPDIVFVGITSPTKEYLIEYLQNQGHNCVFMGVGGSFDVISGYKSRAPKWMQKNNLEWFYRFVQEPRRLFKRYFFGNIIFIKDVVREKYSK